MDYNIRTTRTPETRASGIDLHIHTTASDGTLRPEEIVPKALALGLRAISVTDHDTIKGTTRITDAGIPENIRFLSGVEISTTPPPGFSVPGGFHVLGYGFRPRDPELNQVLETLGRARADRIPGIVRRLNGLGFPLRTEEITEKYRDSRLGRPHIARVMIEKGIVRTVDEAFDKYLSKGRPAYVRKDRAGCAKALEVIAGAGGIPVLAHPGLLGIKDKNGFEKLIQTLKEMGLRGIEAYYPEHTPEETAFYSETAGRHDLLITGGTDFHGAVKPETEMGTGKGDFFAPYSLFEKLERELKNRSGWRGNT